jgi:hypothetical protein
MVRGYADDPDVGQRDLATVAPFRSGTRIWRSSFIGRKPFPPGAHYAAVTVSTACTGTLAMKIIMPIVMALIPLTAVIGAYVTCP